MEPEFPLPHSPVPILSRINPFHVSPSHILKIHFNIILSSSLGLPNGLFPSDLPQQNLMCTSPAPYVLHAPSYLVFLIWSPKQYLVTSTDGNNPV